MQVATAPQAHQSRVVQQSTRVQQPTGVQQPASAFRGMRAGTSWVIAALSACLFSACGGVVELVHSLDESEANEILVVLDRSGVHGEKLKEEGRVITYAIAVGGAQASAAMQILVDNKLPRSRSQGLKETYPVGGGGLIPTKSEEKAKFLMATQGEVERKLKSLPGIIQAHVSVVEPDQEVIRDLDTPPPPATAAVAIVYNPVDDQGTSSVTPDDIKALVAASVEGLLGANVQVVMKQNAIMRLAQGNAAPAPPVQDEQQFRMMVGLGGAAALGLLIGLGAMIRAVQLNSRVRRAEAELAARPRRTGTATGVVGGGGTGIQPAA